MPKKKKSSSDLQKEEIYQFYAQKVERPLTLNDLLNAFDIYDEADKLFVQLMIEELQEKGRLKSVGRNRYIATTPAVPAPQTVVGKVDFVNPRFAFIRHTEGEPDVFVEVEDLNEAWNGDTVEVKILPTTRKKGNNPEGKVIRILERAQQRIVGKVKIFGNYGIFKSDNRSFHQEIFISKANLSHAAPDDIVVVEILSYPQGPKQATGKIVDILGKVGENNAEMNAIMAEFGLPVQFPEEVEQEAEQISTHISDEEIARRRDFRSVLTFTIDPHDAKDFDDALSYEYKENGNVEIGIHIADVTHYVQPGSKLEEEAFRRATSVYLVDRTIPMLPEKLSNGLCSLRPNEDKLVFSAVFEMTPEGKLVKEWFGRAVIHSDKRFAYEEAQEILEKTFADESVQTQFEPVLTHLNTLAKSFREKRFAKGAFNFETPEVKFQLSEDGTPIGIYTKVRKDAHKLIEEFMLLANKRVAEFIFFQHFLPTSKRPKKANAAEVAPTMVYRVHEPPNPEKVEVFAKFASKLGFTVKTENSDVLSKSLNALVQKIEGTPVQNILESLAVRTMSKAKYSTQTSGHFGLAFDHYSHFTSPIRRYPDMMAHRLLQHYLDGGSSADKIAFEQKCKHSSEREKLASEAERASIKYKQVEFMSMQDFDEIYEGVITGVTDFGIFVEIKNTNCEGMVRLADLNDDFYSFEPDNYRVVGQNSGKILTFGDVVEVKIKGTDMQSRSIDLLFANSIPTFSRRGGNTRKRTERKGGRPFPSGQKKAGKSSKNKKRR
jgi:ribonuclease R